MNYQNAGLLELTVANTGGQRTLVGVGVARSGTSLVAGCLHRLGVFMGEKASPPTYEDLALSIAVESGDQASIRDVIGRYDEQHATWGWKRPASLHYLDILHGLFRNPHYIVVFRDLFAIGNRNRLSVGASLLANMQTSIDEYRTLLSFFDKHQTPTLLVSYDKALREKEQFIDHLCKFARLRPSAEARLQALTFVSPSPSDYLNASRAGQVIGHLDVVQPDRVLGWAARRAQTADTTALTVVLEINGQVIAHMPADLPRPDLIQHGAHKTGRAGFEFHLQGKVRLQSGDEVRVFAGQGRDELNHSPWRFTAPTP